jgi:hypothetical protein
LTIANLKVALEMEGLLSLTSFVLIGDETEDYEDVGEEDYIGESDEEPYEMEDLGRPRKVRASW